MLEAVAHELIHDPVEETSSVMAAVASCLEVLVVHLGVDTGKALEEVAYDFLVEAAEVAVVRYRGAAEVAASAVVDHVQVASAA